MTSKYFLKKMEEIRFMQDVEARHVKADDLLCEFILSSCKASKKSIEIFKEMVKWYA